MCDRIMGFLQYVAYNIFPYKLWPKDFGKNYTIQKVGGPIWFLLEHNIPPNFSVYVFYFNSCWNHSIFVFKGK